MTNYLSKVIFLFTIILLYFQNTTAQVAPSSELYQSIQKMDSIIFENGFNKCMLSDMETYISDDLEFYHDQSGPSISKEEFFRALEQNICSNPNMKPMRKLIDGTVSIFPLNNNGVLYGAIQNGVHEFYMKEINKAAYRTSSA